MSMRDCPCWSVCLDAPLQAPLSISLVLWLEALQPPSTVLDSCTSTPGWPCWSVCLDAPLQALFFSSLSLFPSALQPPSSGLDSCTSTPDWPCWSACKDAPPQAPSSSSPLPGKMISLLHCTSHRY